MITTFLLATVLQLGTSNPKNTSIPQIPENAESASNQNSVTLHPIEVSSERQKISFLTKSSLSTLPADEICNEAPKHPNEVFDRIPGAWISRGSGQDHPENLFPNMLLKPALTTIIAVASPCPVSAQLFRPILPIPVVSVTLRAFNMG